MPILATYVLPSHAEENAYQLQPLRFNNPGLVVDLGVGLWAWPLPIDYDHDGDMDLIVSCPDKPSNGFYYFENPSQNPHELSPVFLSGKWLSKSPNNVQISYSNGQPRLLSTNQEYQWDERTHSFDWSKTTSIYPRANVHNQSVRANQWRYVDYDGDGDHDLVIGVGDWSDYGWDHAYDSHGVWKNGPLHGYVYWVENQGNDNSPKYAEEPRYVLADSQPIDVYGNPCPNFADFDGDHDLDVLCGEFLDGFTYFENVGTRTTPSYARGVRLHDEIDRPLQMDLQMITPVAIDWDQDDDLDLVVGDEDGRVAILENTGKLAGNRPVFKQPSYFRQQADTLKCGALATPSIVDWDNDGDQDILCGNTAGYIEYFENVGTGEDKLPSWNAPQRLTVVDQYGSLKAFRVQAGVHGSIQGPAEAKWGYTTLSTCDWDHDGKADIVYNSIHGRIGVLLCDGTKILKQVDLGTDLRETAPAWSWNQEGDNEHLTQWRTTPVAVDFDGDQKLDIVALDQHGFLTLRSAAHTAERIFVNEQDEPLRLNARTAGASGRVKLCVADWDRDGRLDVIANSENAVWWRNVGERKGKTVLKSVGNLADRNVSGHSTSPAVCDFDADGELDLVIGAEDGRLYHINHRDCTAFTELDKKMADQLPSVAPKFPGLVLEEFIYDNAPFPECHASTVCATTRGLVAAWFGGTEEGKKDVGIWVSYHDGAAWSRPTEVANGIQHEGLRYPCWNPVLVQPTDGGPLLLFFKVGPSPDKWWGELLVSYDRGRTFRERQRLPEGLDGPVRCKPLFFSDTQELLCGSSTEYDGWRVHFERFSLRDGKLFGPAQRIGPINDGKQFNAIQPTFLQHADGRIQCLCRTKEGVITSSFSSDRGEQWSALEAISLPNPNSGIEAVSLRDGRHLLIYNHLDSGSAGWGKRGLLNLAISEDGLQWHKVAILEQEAGAEFSYPAIIQTHDGLVHMTYTWKREKIKHVVVDPTDLQTGAVLSRSAW